jgi:predicted DsbA family dithiol-disulfide isomerase
LHPETPAAGITLEDLFAGRNVDLQASQARMRGLMAQEGLPYGQRTRTYNSRLAQELGKWADTQPDGERLMMHFSGAYFVDNKNSLVRSTRWWRLPTASAYQLRQPDRC